MANADDGTSESNLAAFFDGEHLRLAYGRKDAKSSVVWYGVTEFFRSDADADVVIAQIEADIVSAKMDAPAPKPVYGCSARSCLHLYQDNGFDGRHLTFCDRGYWQNLGNYDFNDKLSSYKGSLEKTENKAR